LREPVGDTYARFARRHAVEVTPARLQGAFGGAFRRMPPMVFADEPPQRVAVLEREWWRSLVDDVFRRVHARDEIDDFDAFFAGLYDHFAQPATWQMAAGAAEALSALRERGFSTGVVSNFDRRLLAILDGLGLAALLDVVALPSDAGAAKPSPLIFHFALDRLGVRPHRALYVGDDAEHDVEGARLAGLKSLDVRELQGLPQIAARVDSLLPPAS
jgi:putative hydrolase of the HAD superfamily